MDQSVIRGRATPLPARALGGLDLPTTIRQLVDALGAPLAAIFMVPMAWVGVALWIAIAQHDLRRAGFGFIGLAVGELVARLLRVADIPTLGGGIKANALLTAIAVAWLTGSLELPLASGLLLAVLSAAAAALLAAAIMRALAGTIMPSLVWGFCFVAGALFAVFPAWTALAVQTTAGWYLPVGAFGWLEVFLRSLGSLLFSPSVPAGLMVALSLLLWSRAVFVTGTVGWLVGALTALGMQGLGIQFYWLPASYNFFVAGMALGAVFFLPGRSSLALAAVGGYGAAVFAVALQHLSPGWAYLPVSAALMIWTGLCAFAITDWAGLGSAAAPEDQGVFLRNRSGRIPPEEAWWREVYLAQRFGRNQPLLVVPIPGAVEISQGFDGHLSHAGRWRHALDFQRPVLRGADGQVAPTIWEAPVMAPAAGWVERVRDGVEDNPLGICNYAENWGNYVLLRLDQGNWALVAHLRQGSVAVAPGSRIEIGTRLGAVGNSGRSPVPHLHLQVQHSPELGAATIPFRLANYLEGPARGDYAWRWRAAEVPAERATVAAALPNPMVHAVLSGMSPGTAVWTHESRGRLPRAFRPRRGGGASFPVKVRLDPAGRHLFEAAFDGALVSSHDPDAWRVTELQRVRAPFLRLLALAVPSIPYAAQAGMTWDEPAYAPAGGLAWLVLPLLPYVKQPFLYVRCACRAEPGAQGGPLTLETSLASPQPGLPIKLTTQFERLRGPVRLEAEFPEGSLSFSLLSFQPGLPFGDEPAV